MARGDATTNELVNILLIAGLIYGIKWLVDSGTLNTGLNKLQELGKNLKFPDLMSGGGGACGCKPETQNIGCQSGGSATSVRVNCNSCKSVNYEVRATIQFGGGCGCGGDEATIKHYGPTHQDGNCCWALSTVTQSGDCCFGGEGPHPSTSKCQVKLGNVGSLVGKTVNIVSRIQKTAGGAHQELYVNGQKIGQRDISSWGDSKKTSTVASNQQVELRVDCKNALWLNYQVVGI